MKACTASQALSTQGTLSAKNSTISMKPLTISTSGCCSSARPGGRGIQPSTPIMPTRNPTAYNRKPLAQPSAAASASRLGMSSFAVAVAAASPTARAVPPSTCSPSVWSHCTMLNQRVSMAVKQRSAQPVGLALVQERLHPFLAFVARADVGNALHGGGDEARVDLPLCHIHHQLLAHAHSVGAGAGQGLEQFVHFGVELVSAHDLEHKANAQGFGRAKTLGREEVPVRSACAHGTDHIRADGG